MTELTPLSAWLTGEETLTTSSGRTYRVRPVDTLMLMNEDGGIPNSFVGIIRKNMGLAVEPVSQKERTPEEAKKDIEQIGQMVNRITRACVAYPPLTDDAAVAARGEAIMLHNIPFVDKQEIAAWAMGGEAALNAARRFPQQQGTNVVALQTGGGVQKSTKRNRRVTG